MRCCRHSSPTGSASTFFLLRATDFAGGDVRIGKRTISARLGKGTRSGQGNYQHITEKLNALAEGGFIAIGDTSREGTQYRVVLPDAVPSVREVIATSKPPEKEPGLLRRSSAPVRTDGAGPVDVSLLR